MEVKTFTSMQYAWENKLKECNGRTFENPKRLGEVGSFKTLSVME